MTPTAIRALILALFALIGLFAPGLIPDGMRETIADHATTAIGATLAIWAAFAGHRAATEPKPEPEE